MLQLKLHNCKFCLVRMYSMKFRGYCSLECLELMTNHYDPKLMRKERQALKAALTGDDCYET